MAPVTQIEGASRRKVDSLLQELHRERTDTARASIMRLLSGAYFLLNRDISIQYSQRALALSRKVKDRVGETHALRMLVDQYGQLGNYPKALDLAMLNVKLARQDGDTLNLYWANRSVWRCYMQMRDYRMALAYAQQVKAIVHSGFFKTEADIKKHALMGYLIVSSGAYNGLQQYDSALYYGRISFAAAASIHDTTLLAIAAHNLGDFTRMKNQLEQSFHYYRMAIPIATKAHRTDLVAGSYIGIGRLHAAQKKTDSALRYARLALEIYQRIESPIHELLVTTFLSDVYAQQNNIDSAYKYQSLVLLLKDSLFNEAKTRETQNVAFAEILRLQHLDQANKEARERYKTRTQTYFVAGGLALLLAIGFFFYRLRQIRHEAQLKSGFTKKIHQIEMRALRAQMNPHFIFNCLNSINRYIVKSDHKTASSYLTKFARLIRLILDNSASDTITLDKEIQTLQLYVDMEILRFDNAFQYAIEVDDGLQQETISIPSMLLQPYVENAIWHGLLHKDDQGGKLWIRFRWPAENLLIAEVEDNGVGRQKAKELRSKDVVKNKSYGMQISKDRIFLINELYNTNANVRIDDLMDEQGNASGTKVTVEVPVKDF